MFINSIVAPLLELGRNRSLGIIGALLMVIAGSVVQAIHQPIGYLMNRCDTSQLTTQHCLQNVSSMELNHIVLQFNNFHSERNVTNLSSNNLTEELSSTQEPSLYSESCRQTFDMAMELANLEWPRKHQLLIESITTCNMTLTEALVLLGANFTVKASFTLMPLHLAVFLGRVEMASLFIAAGAEINAREDLGLTPLHCAFYSPNSDAMVRLLAAHGADLEAMNSEMKTALHMAAEYNLPTVQTLVALGANKEARDKDGLTPLDLARNLGHTQVVNWLSAP